MQGIHGKPDKHGNRGQHDNRGSMVSGVEKGLGYVEQATMVSKVREVSYDREYEQGTKIT